MLVAMTLNKSAMVQGEWKDVSNIHVEEFVWCEVVGVYWYYMWVYDCIWRVSWRDSRITDSELFVRCGIVSPWGEPFPAYQARIQPVNQLGFRSIARIWNYFQDGRINRLLSYSRATMIGVKTPVVKWPILYPIRASGQDWMTMQSLFSTLELSLSQQGHLLAVGSSLILTCFVGSPRSSRGTCPLYFLCHPRCVDEDGSTAWSMVQRSLPMDPWSLSEPFLTLAVECRKIGKATACTFACHTVDGSS